MEDNLPKDSSSENTPDNLVEIRDMTVQFTKPKGSLLAVNHVDFDVRRGQLTALVGESGSGKSTLAFSTMGIFSGNGKRLSGEVLFDGMDVMKLSEEELLKFRWQKTSMIFQSAQNALNPLMTVRQHFLETYEVHRKKADASHVDALFVKLLEDVRLEPERVLKSYPHELSGGMRQRVMIAFSMLLNPTFIILDEPTTALDVITQDYIFSIMDDIHKKTNATMLLLTHDIGVVAKVADRIAVMYGGRIVEVGGIMEVFKKSAHPYTSLLIHSAPSLLDKGDLKKPIEGSPPDLMNLPPGCAFHPRCPYAQDICQLDVPELVDTGGGHLGACHFNIAYAKEQERGLSDE